MKDCLEEARCDDYLKRAAEPILFKDFVPEFPAGLLLFVLEGFEERSVALLERVVESNIKPEAVLICEYPETSREVRPNGKVLPNPNHTYRKRFTKALVKLDIPAVRIMISSDGSWILEGLAKFPSLAILVDFTALSHTNFLSTLDALPSERKIYLGYTAAEEYWPRQKEWTRLKGKTKNPERLVSIVESKPWLFGYSHQVAIIPGFEGFDCPGTPRALVGFLPFKAARLAALLKDEDYSKIVLVAGRPPGLTWRHEVLMTINQQFLNGASVIDSCTFDYKRCVKNLMHIFFDDELPLALNYNIRLGLLGSKMQTLSCYIVAKFVPSISVVSSSPDHYFPKAFSSGIGDTWILPYVKPQL